MQVAEYTHKKQTMKNKYLYCFISLVVLWSTTSAQMKKVIHLRKNPIARPATQGTITNILQCSVDTILLTTQADIDNFNTNYPTCTVPNYLLINGENAIPAISNLAGLSSITAVTNKLEIKNTNITSLAALNNITSIGDTLLLERNNHLTNIGLTNLTSLGGIYFSHLPSLNSVVGLCDQIHKTGLIHIDSTNLSNLNGLHTIDSLTTGNGGLNIAFSPIINISALSNLKYLEGYLKLSNNPLQTSIGLTNIQSFWGFLIDGMPLLNSVAGLTNNLTNGNIGTFWFFNTGIPSLVGLEGLTNSSNFYVSGNNNLVNLNGLENLAGNIDNGFSIWGNSSLASVAALSGITNVDNGTIEISYNNISDLNGLQNITDIGRGLWLAGNYNLTTLVNLNNNLVIHNNGNPYNNDQKDSVQIYENTQLSICSDASLCNYFSGGGTALIYNNAASCNSIPEIQANCSTGPGITDIEDNCCIINAIVLAENTEAVGHVGQYDPVADNFIDQYDTYQIILPKAGCIKIFTEANRDSCDANQLGLELLDKEGTAFPSGFYTLINFDPNPCNTILKDSILITALEADTFYLRLQSNNQVAYKIRYVLVDTAGSDAEPNNAITTANFIDEYDTKKGYLLFKRLAYTSYDGQDIYKAYVPGGGAIKVFFKSTYRGRNPLTFSTFNDFNFTVNNSGFSWKSILPNGLSMNYGDVHYDTLQYCTVIGDTVYFKIAGGVYPFEYELKYEVSGAGLPLNDVEPNNSFATATPIAYNELKQGMVRAINYVPASGSDDYEDYYKTYLPKNGKLKVVFTGSNISCNNTNTVSVELYRKNGSSGAPIQPSYSIGDTLFYCSLIADSAYFKISAYYAFSYSIRYEMVDTAIVNDLEPNNSIAQAIPIAKGDTKNGTLSFKNNVFEDVNDYYRIIFTCPDTLKLTSTFTNRSCDLINNFYVGTAINLYSKNGVQIANKAIPNLAAGEIFNDTTSFPIPTADTFYVNYKQTALGSNIASLSYQFTLNNTAPSGTFGITGTDSTCLATTTYKAANICGTGLTYHWNLSSGGVLNAVDSVATVNWTTPGVHTISLYLSNAAGISITKQFLVNVIPSIPGSAPLVLANGRLLKTSTPPKGVGLQWYKNGLAISGATDTSYTAIDSGSYVVKYTNYCGTGASSNSFYFALPLASQSIVFNPLTPDIVYAPNAFAIVKATASSNLPVNYSIVSGPGIVNLDSLKVTGTGTIILAANQAGNINFSPAPVQYDTIQVTQANQTITFNTIPNKKYSDTSFTLHAVSNAALPITYTVTSGNAIVNGNVVTMTGAGPISIEASQTGNANYFAALPVSQNFCIGVSNLSTIQGDQQPCIGSYRYTTKKIVGANYVWSLSSGGTLTFTNDTATVVWNTTGTHTLTVKANSSCDAFYSTVYSLTINPANNVPTAISNMLPANNAINQQLPLALSWVPGSFTVNYDIFIWRSDTLQPVAPFATNITGVTYTIPAGSLAYNKTYKWRVISKNPCYQTASAIQQFSTIPIPDLQVQNVQVPTTAFTGQNITINWTVKNNGPGRTTTNQGWTDVIFLSYDSINPFTVPPAVNPGGWAIFNGARTLLVDSKNNLSALDSGQQYTNSINYTLPVNTTQSLYAYVITNYNNTVLEVTKGNDTARSADKIIVTLLPTPDFRVDSVFAPNTTFSGSTLNVTYKVKNYGANTPAASNWADKFYLSNTASFNINNATELMLPKANGTYYYNAPETKIITTGILQADSSYTKTQPVVIPNFLNGSYFIHVITNATNTVYEGALANNNNGNKQIQVIITPTPKLQITALNVAGDSLSNTQPFNINYTTNNTGFYNNIEKNQGRYGVVGGNNCPPLISSGSGNGVSSIKPNLRFSITDSLGWGSSAWKDNIYLSKDSTGLNSANAILLANTVHYDSTNNIAGDDNFHITGCETGPGLGLINVPPSATRLAYYNKNTYLVIEPLAKFASQKNITLPANLPAGNYYIYVWANADKGVFEYPATNEIKRSARAIIVQNPDLIVSAVTAPSTAYSGLNFTVNYTITTSNNAGVFNTLRTDKFYVSNSPAFDNTATLIGTAGYTENVVANVPVIHSFNYSFPNNVAGTKYFYVVTNADNSIAETSYSNNVNAATVAATVTVTIPPPSATCDLQVSAIGIADTVFSKLPISLQYTVTNNGLGTTQGTWTDSIFISCSPTFNAATASFVALKKQSRSIDGGNSYTDVVNFTTDFANNINSCFPIQQYNNAYFFVKTNADNIVIEGTNTTNNTTGTGLKTLINPWPDYVVTQVSSTKDSSIVGRPYRLSWTVQNLKFNYTANYFQDAIYFSTDSVFNGYAVLANDLFNQYQALGQNQLYSETANFTTPNIPTGDYYVFARTNATNNIYNEITTNNTNLIRKTNGSAKKIHVVKLPLPDFTDSIVAAPITIAVGQPLIVKTAITNNGAGANYPSNFSNQVWLNTNFAPGGYDLGSTNASAQLNVGQSYTDSISLTMPLNIPAGNYILVWHTNNTNSVFETNVDNNLAFKYITVTHPTPVDLMVNHISIPDTAYLGYPIDPLKWSVVNSTANAANGFSSDGIYLSKSTLLDSTATLLGINQRYLQMLPLQKDTLTKQVIVNNVAEGNYNVLVKTDVLNNIVETDKANNVGLATKKLFVKVVTLPLDVLQADSLSNSVYRYYKLKIPDSLRGSTIQVTLTTNDSLTRINQMYIGAGYVPNPANFDYKFATPNYGNQSIVMTSVNDSVYYITLRNVNSTASQNIRLKAVKLPFTILNVQSNTGGNTGNVTVKISGNLFNNNMVATLKRNSTTITASNIYFVNSTTVFATFNLAAQPLGIYDISLFKKNDSSTAILSNGFSIVAANNGGLITGGGVNGIPGNGNDPGCDPNAASGLNAQLVTEIVAPDKIFIPFPYEIQINFSNPTNVDVPAQTKIMYADNKVQLALTKAGLATGASSLYISFTEPGGPPGIIRAGASGTITVYAKAPDNTPGHTFLNYTLK